MKKVSFFLLMALGVWAFPACHSNSSVNSADSTNEAKADSGMMQAGSDAADFAVKAANGGMAEVELGRVAQDMATSQRVKDFGAMMVRDHSKVNDELKAIAMSKNITLPDSVSTDARQDIDKLKNDKKSDFDKDYIDMMVSDHKNDIDEFQKASNNLNDGELKSFATKSLPTLQMHLDSAQAIQNDLKNK